MLLDFSTLILTLKFQIFIVAYPPSVHHCAMAHSSFAFFGRMVWSGLITDFIGQGTFPEGDSVVVVALVVCFS